MMLEEIKNASIDDGLCDSLGTSSSYIISAVIGLYNLKHKTTGNKNVMVHSEYAITTIKKQSGVMEITFHL